LIDCIVPELNISVRLTAFDSPTQKIPFKKALLAASRAGVRGVEIEAGNHLRPSDLTDTAKRQLRKMLDDFNLRISSIRFQTRRGYDVMANLDERIDATKQMMRMAYALGAPYVVNQIGQINSNTESASWRQLRSSMEDRGKFGAHVGAFLAAETGTDSGEDLAKLLNDFEGGFISVAYNPGQLIVNEHDAKESLKQLGERVGLVIAQDGVLDLAKRRGVEVPLGYGTADFPEILGMLEDHQYRGFFVVGRPDCGAQEVSDAISYLKNL
jgi:sugar phosphate isomerase/epimerase